MNGYKFKQSGDAIVLETETDFDVAIDEFDYLLVAFCNHTNIAILFFIYFFFIFRYIEM